MPRGGLWNVGGLKHGCVGTRTYIAWKNMRQRCYNKNKTSYHRYGGRGIYVCERWDSFENFLLDMGKCPDGMELDRIDNDGPYTKNNCRWVTHATNCKNRVKASKISVYVKLSTEELERYLEYLRGEE